MPPCCIASIARGNLHNLRYCHACVSKVSFRQSGMNLEHETGLAKFPRHWMPVTRPHGFRKSLFQIDLAAGARKTWNAFGGNGFLDSGPVPTLAQTLRPYVDVVFVIRMPNIVGRPDHPQGRNSAEFLTQECRVPPPLLDHTRQFPQQHAPDRRLRLSESPIRTKGFVQKAVSRGMVALVHRLEALAVVLEAPTQLP